MLIIWQKFICIRSCIEVEMQGEFVENIAGATQDGMLAHFLKNPNFYSRDPLRTWELDFLEVFLWFRIM